MRVIIFGATGMVGQGVLRECLKDSRVESVLSIVRSTTGTENGKLKELKHGDFSDYEGLGAQLTPFDACFFCLGTPSAGKTERDYRRVTYEYAVAAAQTLARLNPGMTFIYVSGVGADSSEKGPVMWARVRGLTENTILRLPFKAAHVFRLGMVQPLNGIQSRTAAYRIFYSALKPLLPILRACFPSLVSTTEDIGRAMISVAVDGFDKKMIGTSDLRGLAQRAIKARGRA